MARVAETTRASTAPAVNNAVERAPVAPTADKEKVLPLPRWLTRVYYIFPIILYIPDGIFNFYVYTDGAKPPSADPVTQAGFFALWTFVSIGLVGMAYLFSVLAPWHWGQGHKIQAIFCGVGLLVATAITTWNSLAYRSETFTKFNTDQWIYNIWPQLKAANVSITMILVAVAPPFWGLFWAIVQPTRTGRTLEQIQESHAEKLLRTQQEAELKATRAEANARVRAAQLKGMAATAAAARTQARAAFGRKDEQDGNVVEGQVIVESDELPAIAAPSDSPADSGSSHNVIQYPTFAPSSGRDLAAAGGRGGMTFSNHAAAASPTTHAAPSGARVGMAQPALGFDADVQGAAGVPASDAVSFTPRRPATLLGNDLAAASQPYEMSDAEAMTGTSGPRRAMRRPNELGTLNRTMNEPLPPNVAESIGDVMRELRAASGKKTIASTVLVPAVAERLGVDNATAQKLIGRYSKAESQRTARN
jgi:hypothetical protein